MNMVHLKLRLPIQDLFLPSLDSSVKGGSGASIHALSLYSLSIPIPTPRMIRVKELCQAFALYLYMATHAGSGVSESIPIPIPRIIRVKELCYAFALYPYMAFAGSGDPPEPEELITALQDLENAASSDAEVRYIFSVMPDGVFHRKKRRKKEGVCFNFSLTACR